MTHEYAVNDLADIVIDEYSTAILTATSTEPAVVSDIVDEFGMSTATAYRRIRRLCECDLIEEQTRLDETGNQYHVYEATFQSIAIEILNGIAYVHIVRENNHAVTRLWEYQANA